MTVAYPRPVTPSYPEDDPSIYLLCLYYGLNCVSAEITLERAGYILSGNLLGEHPACTKSILLPSPRSQGGAIHAARAEVARLRATEETTLLHLEDQLRISKERLSYATPPLDRQYALLIQALPLEIQAHQLRLQMLNEV